MYAQRHSIKFTTHSSAGTFSGETDEDVNGRILQVQYKKTDLGDGSTITLTGNTTGVPIFTITAMNASAIHLPRKATTDQAGAAITYDATHAVHESIVVVREKVKLEISSGDNSKTGEIIITVG